MDEALALADGATGCAVGIVVVLVACGAVVNLRSPARGLDATGGSAALGFSAEGPSTQADNPHPSQPSAATTTIAS